MGFDVEPEHLGGFAEMLAALNDPFDEACSQIAEHGKADGLDGILGELLEESVAEASRAVHRTATTANAAVEATAWSVRVAAWEYTRDEATNTERFDPTAGRGGMEPLPGSVRYPLNAYPPLAKPDSPLPSPEEVADDLSGLAGFLDFVMEIAASAVVAGNNSPTGAALRHVLCEWRALDRAGIALEQAADRLCHVEADINLGLERLLQHWRGGAADACAAHVRRLSAGVGDIGAYARILGEAYQVAAMLVQKSAAALVKGIDEQVNSYIGTGWKFFAKTITRLIPFVGQIIAVKDAVKLVDHLTDLFDNINRLIKNTAKRLQESCIAQIVDNLGGSRMQAGRINFALNDIMGKAGEYGPKATAAAELMFELEEVGQASRRLNDSPDDIENMPTAADIYQAGGTESERRRPS